MLIKELANNRIKPFNVSDSVEYALAVMGETGHALWPVVDQTTNRFAGMVSQDILKKNESKGSNLLALREENPIVSDFDQNIYDTARLMDKHEVSVIPVLDSSHRYLGIVERFHLYDHIVRILNLTEYGSLLTIHFNERDFTLSKLVHIIESEGGLILGLGVDSPRDNQPFYIVSIKINLSDPARIVSSLKRHDYIVESHGIDNQDTKRYEERADEFLHYLNI